MVVLFAIPGFASTQASVNIAPVLSLLLKNNEGTPLPESTPQVFSLVEATSVFTDRVTVSWIPAGISKTSIKYHVHIGDIAGFDLNDTLVKKTVTGSDNTTVSGLSAGKEYHVRVVAEDGTGGTSWSNEMTFKTPSQDPALRAGVVTKIIEAEGVLVTINENSVIYPATGEALPQTGEFITSNDPLNGLLRKVISSSEINGIITVQTEEADLMDIYENLSVSFNARLDSSDNSAEAATKLKRISSNSSTMKTVESARIWEESGFGILSADVGNNTSIQLKGIAAKTVPTSVESATNTRVRITSANTPNAFEIGKTQSFQIEISKTSAGTVAGWILGGLEINEFDKPGITSGNVQSSTYSLKFVSEVGDTKKYEFTWTPAADDYDPDLGKFTLDLVGKAEASEETCTDYIIGNYCSTDTEEVELRLEFLLVKGNEIDFDEKKSVSNTSIEAELKYGIDADYTFTPEFFSEVDISTISINKVEAGFSGTVSLQGELSLNATAAGKYENEFPIVPLKRFYKIIPSSPPVLLSGSFKLDGKLAAEANGEMDIKQKITLARELKYTMRCTDGCNDASDYELLKEDNPSATYSLTGEANAEASVTVSLIPEFRIAAYELPYAAINYELYLEAGAGIDMVGDQALYVTPDVLVAYQDMDYRFTRLDLIAGGVIGWRLGVKGFKKDIIGYPSNDPEDLKQVDFPAAITLIGIPSLSLSNDADFATNSARISPRDYSGIQFIQDTANQGLEKLSRTLAVESGRVKVFRKTGGTSSYTEDVTSLVTLFWSDEQDTTKPVWLGFPGAGEYKVRYSAYSQFGSWAKQYDEVEINLVDSNSNQIPDYWESRFGVGIAANDDDNDGLTNLEEYSHHTDPTNDDSDGDGVTDGVEVAAGQNPLDAENSDESLLTLTGGTVTEGDSGTKILDFTLNLNQYQNTAMVDYSTQDGTATIADGDYISSSGTVSFVGGSTSETVSITVNGDTEIESDETFSLALSNPVNLRLLNSNALGNIVDDDTSLSTGLVAHYKFNGDATDIVGSNDGAVYGAILTEDRFGNNDEAYSFNGTSDYIDCGSDAVLNITGSMTITAWIKVTTDGSIVSRVRYDDGTWASDAYTLEVVDGKIYFNITDGNLDAAITTDKNIADNSWHFVAAVFDQNKLKVTIDDFPSVEQAGPTNILSNTNLPLYIGASPQTGGGIERFIKGTIDEVRLYKRALSESEIAELYNQETPAGTVTSAGQVWMDRNLGASRVAQSFNDEEAYGDLYQWGRGTDGHEKRNSPITSTLSATDDPGHGSFITSVSYPYDWRTPQNDNLWQGVSGINNPCPSGFRLPTSTELEAERVSWSSNNYNGAFVSPLKLVAAGYRHRGSGTVSYAGSYGYFWSSTVIGSYARTLYFNSGNAYMHYTYRAYGVSARCLED